MLQQLVRQCTSRTASALILTCSLPAASCRWKSQATIDYTRYPKLNEDELDESFMRGSGPGGQAVNKTSNCVFLRHIPTNIIVKCHTHRLASKNRVEARRLMLDKLDAHYNGEHSVAAQLKAIDMKKSAERKRRQQKINEMKKTWQERERAISENDQDPTTT